MQTYETVVVVAPKLSDEEVADFADKTKKFIVKGGGEIVGEDKWGRRKLAYPIGQDREGTYLYFKFNAQGALVNKLSQHFRILDTVLRTMTVQYQEPKPPKEKKPKKTASASAAAPAARPQA
jgi:small subunit ribosomal protein S6